MTADEQKLEILRKVESGSLTIEEGADLIGMLDQKAEEQSTPQRETPGKDETTLQPPNASGCWKAAWSMILVSGAVLSGFSAFWVYQGYQKSGFGWGFWLSWIPLLIGIALMIFGWALMESPWMHVRIQSKDQYKAGTYVFSMPVPFNIVRWGLRNFGHFIQNDSHMDGEALLAVLDEAEASIRKGEPFRVQVDEEDEGTKVDIFIN